MKDKDIHPSIPFSRVNEMSERSTSFMDYRDKSISGYPLLDLIQHMEEAANEFEFGLDHDRAELYRNVGAGIRLVADGWDVPQAMDRGALIAYEMRLDTTPDK